MAGNADYTEAVARPRNAGGADSAVTMGIPYDAPERGAGASDAGSLTTLGLVWRIVASLVLAALGVNAVVQIVRIMVQPEPLWVAALGMAVLAIVTLAYPIVNVVRWVRATRRRQRPAA
ncbi:hypothetical protein SAMN02800687_0919 [Curtobacterium sp. UNCCL20]|uniref:hypothetical protein n=1 Tax=Curtobacterium sp. UNCCL20 TaxID=1502773 RepID=UPI0008833590|nr:hypothetical protein [Curtobacterium sp. UNCCL20]SDQ22221.1 hypothetical protein SAMN02800687_0919 [Curtobacterium sp. UNCCL20]